MVSAPRQPLQAAPLASVPGTGGYDHPKSDIGNPFLLASVLDKVDGALGDAIAVIQHEGAGMAAAGEGDPLLKRFREWRAEIDQMRPGAPVGEKATAGSSSGVPAQEGGLFAD